jgi:hypothetical protein
LVCFFSASQFLQAQSVPDPEKEEKANCEKQTKYSYEVDGKRYFVPYEVIDGQDVVEGDIVIGQSESAGYFPPIVPPFVNLQAKRWSGNEVPFVIDSSATQFEADIRKAMSMWTGSNPNLKFTKLFGPRDWRKENYVKFIFGPADKKVCQSNGLGVKQKVSQPDDEEHNINVVTVGNCDFGRVPRTSGRIAHEIGHVLGMGHEQSRKDRNQFIRVVWNNIDDGDDLNGKAQFCRGIRNVTLPNTAYDFDSIMHYSPLQATKASGCQKVQYGDKEQCVAFVPLEKDWLRWPSSIGQRDHLSNGDIEAVNTLYPPLKKTEPPPGPQPSVPPCVIVTKTTIRVGDRTIETTKTEACTPGVGPIPGDQQCCQERGCCQEKIVVAPSCHHDRCRRPVKVNWPRPDRWCRSEWCRPWPRPRPLCDREGWIEDRPPFDDWDDRSEGLRG